MRVRRFPSVCALLGVPVRAARAHAHARVQQAVRVLVRGLRAFPPAAALPGKTTPRHGATGRGCPELPDGFTKVSAALIEKGAVFYGGRCIERVPRST